MQIADLLLVALLSGNGLLRAAEPAPRVVRTPKVSMKMIFATSVAYSPDGKTVAIGGVTDGVVLLDGTSGEEKTRWAGQKARTTAVIYSADGTQLAISSADNTIKVWAAETGALIHKLTVGSSRNDVGGQGIAFSPDGRTLVSTESNGTIRLWDVTAGRERMPAHNGDKFLTKSLTFSPDGKVVAVGTFDQTVKICDAETLQEVQSLSGHKHNVYAIQFDAEGKRLASSSFDGMIMLWNTRDWKPYSSQRGHRDGEGVYSLSFTRNGQLLASGGGDGVVKLWKAATGELLAILDARPASRDPYVALNEHIWSVAFSPDGRTLASGHHRYLRFWDIGSLSLDDEVPK